ncbi:ferritin-like domain-containing protein [Tenacibaculum sp. ZS6-P6]|uniref:ferritin-like domain-containing protein n=1 Tax=Tenacibaculum sp. ZS6-P6 TaxID=3447503 RepID=UPI003F9D6F43
MYNYTQEIASQLNGLLIKNYDAEKGYQTAAENVDSDVLTSLFERKAKERKKFGNELKKEIRLLGEKTKQEGSKLGTIHRTWMDTRAFFSLDNDKSILEEAIRGEKASVKEYNEVINSKEHLPKTIVSLLKNQRNSILNDTILIKKLEDIK